MATSDPIAELAKEMIRKGQAVGISITMIRHGNEIYSKAFGCANLETNSPMTLRSGLMAGSITKPFTAAAVLRLREEEKLSIDDPMTTYFPDYPSGREITLRHLLTHTSGLSDIVDPRPNFMQRVRMDHSADEMYAWTARGNVRQVHSPGTVWNYRNASYVEAGLIVERISGKSYADFVKEEVIASAGLNDTAIDDAAEVVEGRASGYVQDPDNADRWVNAPFFSRSVVQGAGALRSTSSDLCRWLDALLDGKVLEQSSLTEMRAPHRVADGQLPRNARGIPFKKQGETIRYGLGLDWVTMGGKETIGHHASFAGFVANMFHVVDHELTVAFMANASLDLELEQIFMQAAINVGLATER